MKVESNMNGGSVDTVLQLVKDTPLTPVLTVNPNSRFVVATYWWGTGNLNKNLQRPCPEEIMEPVKEAMEEELGEDDPEYKEIYERVGKINQIRRNKKASGQPMTDAEKAELKEAYSAQLSYLVPYFSRQNVKDSMVKRYAEEVEKLKQAGKFKEPVTFNEMIETWKQTCEKAQCNYLVVEYPIDRSDYQNGINAKPAFIRKALDACPGKGVLYIDGDMYVNKYPSIFDMKNVDYMARGWNIDPRSSMRYKTDVCFDPYIFETSGGTMYFGNTELSRQLLDQWSAEMNKPENKGKAEDRIISMIVTQSAFALKGNMIQLPIEYLWLTDIYADKDPADASQSNSIIEHPACLTGEERAGDQGAASNRQPDGYDSKISNVIECTRRGGVFYEFVFFPRKEMVSGFGPYLEYLKCAKNFSSGEPLFEVVGYDDKYGRYNSVAYENDSKARSLPVDSSGPIDLPLTATIPEILANLYKGRDVRLGGSIEKPVNSEFVAHNVGGDSDHYIPRMKLDTTKPMYISTSNVIIQHMLRMCKDLSDINKHLSESYVFVSRIRWSLIEVPESQVPPPLEPIPTPASIPVETPLPASVPVVEPTLASVPVQTPTASSFQLETEPQDKLSFRPTMARRGNISRGAGRRTIRRRAKGKRTRGGKRID